MERKQAADGCLCNQRGNICDKNHSPNNMAVSTAPGNVSKSAIASSVKDNNNKEQETLSPVHDDKSECGSLTLARPIGLKRKISRTKRNEKKRCCDLSAKCYDEANVAIVQELDPNITADEAHAILVDYNHALKILKSQNTCNAASDENPSLEYMIQLINDWKPKSEIICMYVRWSKRLRRNYHLDSISTLLCVANQCDYTPHTFLKNIKTLTISCSTTTYGLNFKFETCKNQAADGKKLNERFLGLSITLRLLQRGVVSGIGTFGNVGLKTSSKPNQCNDEVYMAAGANNKQKYVVANKPTSRFHTNGGLLARIWLAIQHRWISIQIVEMLFPTQLAKAKTEQESLAFSFQMHSSTGPTRYDFLDPLIGVCLRFRSTSIIDNQANILGTVWEKPGSFVAFGNGFLHATTEKDRIQYIVETFGYLKSTMTNWTKITMHAKTEREVKWQMVRGYAFHFWLDSIKNKKLKFEVNDQCKGLKQPIIPKPKASCAKISASKQVEACTMQKFPSQKKNLGTKKMSPVGLSLLLTTRNNSAHSSMKHPPTPQPAQESQQQICLAKDSTKSVDTKSFAWGSIRLATKSEVTSLVSSHLLIHCDDGIDMIAELSPLEVYSADNLYKLRHSRLTSPPGCFPKSELGSVVLSVGADVDKFVDKSSKIYHVAREDSPYFMEHGYLIPSMCQITNLCKAVLKYGKCDTNRCPQQFRINIGCGGQHRPQGKPETLVGLRFKSSLLSDMDFNAEEIMGTIGMMTEFTWNILKDMQVEARDGPLAPDQVRHREYARHLSNYLKTSDNVGFEDVTVVVGMLYPLMPNVAEHIDHMNDSVAGYTRTGVFNVVLLLQQGVDPILLHVQVICNFRRVIREYILPFNSLLSSISVHCKQYLAKWQNNINQVYGGQSQLVPHPFDRTNFFVDDCLPFATITISSGSQNPPTVTGEYLLTEVSPSRVLSFSMFIDPIVDLKEILCYDQRLELCFVASVLSNPFWFERTITSLTQKHLNPENPFCFGVHPLNDWSKETVSIFGSWQGGPHNRWSPFGGGTPFPTLFGAHPGATKQEQKRGETLLEAVIQVLYHHLQWVNSLDEIVSDDILHDLPLSMIENHMTSVTEAIFKIVPCQFNVFRLQVFTTLVAGCGEIKQGVHLKALMYPAKGSASFKHLMHPHQDQITRTQALSLCSQQEHPTNIYANENEGVQSQRHDQLMLYLSNEIGMTRYLRDETECVLCEGHPNRNLQCRDWFKKGRRLYDCNMEGNILQRNYGRNTQWVQMQTLGRGTFAFLNEVISYQPIDEVLKDYSMAFGELLQKSKSSIKFCGRNSRTSDNIQQYNNEYMADTSKLLSGIRHRAANFYYGEYTREQKITSIQVLGDGEVPVMVDSECNDISRFPDGLRLWKYVLSMICPRSSTSGHRMYSARYHQHQEESDYESKTVIFPGHLDKAFVASAMFLPLTSRYFFTIIAVPTSWNMKQDGGSKGKLQDWMRRIPVEEKRMVDDLLQNFLHMAETFMKVKVEMRVFFMTVGSMLLFPANICFHTTITPGNISPLKNPRDLFIIHTTASTQR